MKKAVGITTGVIAIAAGAWLGASWYTGTRIETRAQQRLEDLNRGLAEVLRKNPLNVTTVFYERGLLSTQARYAVHDQKGHTTEFDVRISHGPLPLAGLAKGHWEPSRAFIEAELVRNPQMEKLWAATKDQNPLQIEVVAGYRQRLQIDAAVAAVSVNEPDLVIASDRMTLQAKLDRKTRTFDGRFDIPMIASQGKGVDVKAVNFGGKLAGHMGNFEIPVGEGELHIGQIDVKLSEQGAIVRLDNARAWVNAAEDAKFVRGEFGRSMDRLIVNDTPLGGLETRFTLSQLQGESLKHVVALLAQAFKHGIDKTELDNDTKTELGLQLMGRATTLLDGQPTIAIDPVAWKNDKGESRVQISLTMGRPMVSPGKADLFLAQLFRSGKAELKLSPPMLHEAATSLQKVMNGLPGQKQMEDLNPAVDRILAFLKENELVIEKDGLLVAELSMQASKLTLNGKPFDPATLKNLDKLKGAQP